MVFLKLGFWKEEGKMYKFNKKGPSHLKNYSACAFFMGLLIQTLLKYPQDMRCPHPGTDCKKTSFRSFWMKYILCYNWVLIKFRQTTLSLTSVVSSDVFFFLFFSSDTFLLSFTLKILVIPCWFFFFFNDSLWHPWSSSSLHVCNHPQASLHDPA